MPDLTLRLPWDPTPRDQPFSVAQDIAAADQAGPQFPTFGEAMTQAQADMGPAVQPMTIEQLTQSLMQAEAAARKALNPMHPAARAALAMIPLVGPIALAGSHGERDVQRLADQVAAEDYKQKVLEQARQETQKRLDIQQGQSYLSGLKNIFDPNVDPTYRPAMLKFLNNKYGMPKQNTAELSQLFLAAAKLQDRNVIDVLNDAVNNKVPMSTLHQYGINPEQLFNMVKKKGQENARETVAGQIETNVPGVPGQVQAGAIRAGMNAPETAAAVGAVTPPTPQLTIPEQIKNLPAEAMGLGERTVSITQDQFGQPKMTATYSGQKVDVTNDFDAYAMKNFGGRRFSQLQPQEMAKTLTDIEAKNARIQVARQSGDLAMLGTPEEIKAMVNANAKDIVAGIRAPESVRTQYGRLNAILGPMTMKRVNELGGMPVPLTQAGQKILSNIDPVQQQVRDLKTTLEPFKDINSRFFFGLSYLQYRTGKLPENDLHSAFQRNAEMALTGIQSITPYMRGMRNMQWVERIEVHVPKPWVDSPANMYKKLETMDRNFDLMKQSAYKYERKSGVPSVPEEWSTTVPNIPTGGSLGVPGKPKILSIEKVAP